MGKKLLKTFTNNIGFKILAIAFAFILWLVVYNLNDPVKTKTFTTTVTVTGTEQNSLILSASLIPIIRVPYPSSSAFNIRFSFCSPRS